MEDKATLAETLKRVRMLEEALNRLSELRDEAFFAFKNPSLNKMNEIFETSWKELFCWNLNHETDGVPHFYLQDYSTVQGNFLDVTDARKNRKEFADSLAESREAVEECIEKIRTKLSEEEKKLDELYNEFVQSTGDFKFIFESPIVKQLIIDKLLKS